LKGNYQLRQLPHSHHPAIQRGPADLQTGFPLQDHGPPVERLEATQECCARPGLNRKSCFIHAECTKFAIQTDPPIAAYTNGFTIFENPPLVDEQGYLNLPQKPGLGVTIDKELISS
jgi:hypothetical protein